MKKHYYDAVDYNLTENEKKRVERLMWVCSKCKTKNMKINQNCYLQQTFLNL